MSSNYRSYSRDLFTMSLELKVLVAEVGAENFVLSINYCQLNALSTFSKLYHPVKVFMIHARNRDIFSIPNWLFQIFFLSKCSIWMVATCPSNAKLRSSIHSSFKNLPIHLKVELLRSRDSKLSAIDNNLILNASINYIMTTNRFSVPLFWYSFLFFLWRPPLPTLFSLFYLREQWGMCSCCTFFGYLFVKYFSFIFSNCNQLYCKK